MNILAVSDQVLKPFYDSTISQRFPDVDLLIGCGDLPYYYLEFLHSALDTTLLYVRGNHDDGGQYTSDGRQVKVARGGIDLHGRIKKIGSLYFAGLEGSMRYKKGSDFMYTEAEMRWQVAELALLLWWNRIRNGRALDVLVTHSPPFGIHDRPDIAHTGFKSFLWLLRVFRPRYLLHGHIHIYRNDTCRVTRYYDTHIINVYPFYALDFDRPPAPENVIP